jgi:large subunit ribosomal protein L15
MQLHDLKAPEGAHKRRKRIGRGTGSGHGKTSGRGTKGQNSRGSGWRIGFEGGQMPLAQRLPKLGGFKNPFKIEYAIVNVSKLSRFKDGTTLDQAAFVAAGLADAGQKVKILGAGKLRRKLNITADAISDTARTAIEARGGTVSVGAPAGRAAARRVRAAAKLAAETARGEAPKVKAQAVEDADEAEESKEPRAAEGAEAEETEEADPAKE